MIGSLTGVVASVGPGRAVIEVTGVGYLVFVPASVLAMLRAGVRARLITHLVVREDSMTLYGFDSPDQRDLFQGLLSVAGVGPKLALAILSVFSPEALRRVIAAGDPDALTTVPGIGKRGAQRVLLELKERLGTGESLGVAQGSRLAEVREALLALGYSSSELPEVLDRLAAGRAGPGPEAPVGELVRAALKELAGASPRSAGPRGALAR